MSVTELVRDLRSRGIRVRAKGDQLVVQAAAGALTSELKERIALHKPALIALLRDVAAQPDAETPQSLVGMAERGKPPLAPAQRRFWYLQRMDPSSALYNLPGIWRLKGPLDVDVFRAAIQTMVDRHDVLRSRFTASEGHPVLTLADFKVDMPLKDFSDLPAAEREAAMGAFIEATIEVPIDIEQGPPFRAVLMRLSPEEHAILWMPHSIVWDGWSFDLLLHEFSAHYRASIEGQKDALPPLPIQFGDFAAWQNQRLERGEFDAHLDYWRQQLAGPIPSLNLPTDRERTPGQGYEGARVWNRIDGALLDSIRELARVEGVTTYMVLLAAVNALMYRYSGVRDVLIASPLQGRAHPELEDLIGVFVNTLFFRTRVDPNATFRTLLHAVRDTCLEAVQHQDAPSDMVIEAMEESGLRRTPYEMIFIYQQATGRVTEMGPITVGSVGHGIHHVAVDLVMWTREHPNHIDFGFDYRTTLFDDARIRRAVGHIKSMLAAAARGADTRVGDLEILTPEELRDLSAWAAGPPAPAPVAGSAPHAESEVRGGAATPPMRGEALHNALAAARAGVARCAGDDAVAVLVDGSVESALVIAALNESNIDALFVTPGLTASVIDDLCARVGARSLLASAGAPAMPGARINRVVLNAASPAKPPASAKPAARTKGSVRVPVPAVKGGWDVVERTWDSLRTDAAVLCDLLEMSTAARIALYPSGSPEQFAAAVMAAFSIGANLVLTDPRLPPDGWDLEDQITGGVVNAVFAGSGTLRQLADTGWQARVGVIFCGDPLMSPSVRSVLSERAARLVVGWGMVEAGPCVLVADQSDLDAGALGRPAAGVMVLVADAQGHALPIGVPGDLWVGTSATHGDGNAARFATPPGARARMFNTGERVRWSSDGRLVSNGHARGEEVMDGRRVAFADIEAALRSEPSIRDAHVAVQRIDGERRLAAFAAPHDGKSVTPADVRTRLREKLGAALVPDAIVEVPALARHDDGSIDEARLAVQLRAAASPRRHAEPRSAAERAVADAWKAALNTPTVGLADNFFELGGHSLLAVQVTLKLEEESGLRIDPRSLFFQSLEQVAAGATGGAKAVAASAT